MQFLRNHGLGRKYQVRTIMPNFIVVASKMWVYGPKNRKKMVIFGRGLYKFSPRGKYRGSTEKIEYTCTTNLPLCIDTIIVLKITLLHGISVITNFVIPKRDKPTKNITLFRLYSRRATHDHTTMGTVIEEVRPIFAPP